MVQESRIVEKLQAVQHRIVPATESRIHVKSTQDWLIVMEMEFQITVILAMARLQIAIVTESPTSAILPAVSKRIAMGQVCQIVAKSSPAPHLIAI